MTSSAESARGARTIVKVNIEGEESPTILGTPASAWADVAEVYIETHPWATCGATELAEHLVDAGLRSVPSNHSAVLKLSRAETPRRE